MYDVVNVGHLTAGRSLFWLTSCVLSTGLQIFFQSRVSNFYSCRYLNMVLYKISPYLLNRRRKKIQSLFKAQKTKKKNKKN